MWIVAVIGAVLVGTIAQPSSIYRWLSVDLVVVVFVTFVIQLALPTKDGLVLRMAASIGGAVILLAVATAVLVLVRA